MRNLLSTLFFIASAITLGIGIYNMTEDGIRNAFVGGDAYNFIINANLAIAYIALAIFFSILGFGTLLTMKPKSSSNTDSSNEEKKE
ncbi:MAG: hypothetical protein RBR21_11525 [Bacteroidales bacterium]|nr:hypothetical protein [Bacteroidales bacterium]